jgi:hypothetical protein
MTEKCQLLTHAPTQEKRVGGGDQRVDPLVDGVREVCVDVPLAISVQDCVSAARHPRPANAPATATAYLIVRRQTTIIFWIHAECSPRVQDNQIPIRRTFPRNCAPIPSRRSTGRPTPLGNSERQKFPVVHGTGRTSRASASRTRPLGYPMTLILLKWMPARRSVTLRDAREVDLWLKFRLGGLCCF